MKKHGLKILIAIIMIGCSWRTNLVVLNKTNHAITIEYKLKSYDMQPNTGDNILKKGYVFNPPKIITINELGKAYYDFPVNEHTYDESTGTVITGVPPGKAIWIDSLSNYSGHQTEFYYDHMNIKEIIIKSDNGEIKYEGMDLLKAFKKYHWGLGNHIDYAIIIK